MTETALDSSPYAVERRRASPYLLLALTPLLWSGNWVLAKILLGSMSPAVLTTTRWTLATAFMLWLTRREPRPAIRKQDVLLLFMTGLTGIAGYSLIQYIGLGMTSAIIGSLLHSASPVFTILLAIPLLREPITWRQYGGAAVSMTGVAIIITGGRLTSLDGWQLNIGDLVLLIATVVWALYSILGRLSMRRFSPTVTTAYSALAALPVLWLITWINLRSGPPPQFGLVEITGILYMAFFSSVLGFIWWNVGIGAVGAGVASVFGNLLPLYTALLAIPVLGDELTIPQVFGGIAVLAGVVLATRNQQSQRST